MQVPPSPIRKLVPFATRAKEEGVRVYHLNIGDPDIETPAVMIEALKNWSTNPIAYSDSHGQAELLKSLAGYYRNLGFEKIFPADIQITLGGSEAILWLFLATANPGDEYIVFEPFYANYQALAMLAKVKLTAVTSTIKNGFHLPNVKDIEGKITPRTRGILICNPGNPTGTVYTKEEIETLLALAKKHKLYLAADEVYREFTYDGAQAVSLLNYASEYQEGIIVLDSLSKRYSLCGGRLGALVTLNRKFMEAVLKFAQARLSAGLIDQVIAAKLDQVPAAYFQKVNEEYRGRRNLLYEGLSRIPGVTVSKPEGAFYIIAGLPVKDAEDFARWLLTDFRDGNETVMVAPARGFYHTAGLGANEVRLAYVINKQSLARSVTILNRALQVYNG